MGSRRLLACISALAVLLAGSDAAPVDAASRPKTRAPSDQLEVERKVRVGSAHVYRYRQVVGGYEVLGAEAIVEADPSADRVVVDSTSAKLREPAPAAVSKKDATSVARRAMKVKATRDATRAKLGLLPKGKGVLVWQVQIPSLDPLGDFEVLVDAHSARVLRTADRLKNLQTGSAQVFDPNPPVTEGDFPVGLVDNGNADSAELTALRHAVTLERIADGQDCLSGQFVAAKIVRRHRRKRVCRAGLDWTDVTRSSASFEALMAYFHIDRMQNYIQQDLGIFDANNRQQVVIANAFKADNAFYSPFTKRIELGKGGVDDGEDADVIIHEYGHAIQDNFISGFGISFDSAAMGEGFGDYMAAVASSELSAPSGGSPSWDVHGCIAEWDATSYAFGPPFCLRHADYDTEDLTFFRSFCGQSFHCLGQVWSSALYFLREDLAGPKLGQTMDEIALRAHDYMGRSPTFSQAAQALLDADDALNGGANQATISAEMVKRGFL